jgi:hypothetical protein
MATAQGFTQDALAQTLAVAIRRVEKRYAQIDSRLDLVDRLPFCLRGDLESQIVTPA